MERSATSSIRRRVVPRLPRRAWILIAGACGFYGSVGFVSAFLVIYLHDVRGIGLGIAGVALGATAFAGLASSPVVGAVADRFGARPTLISLLAIGALLTRELTIDATHVPAQAKEGIAETINHVIAGETDLMISPIAITLPHLDDGRLVPLGVTTSRRSRVIPEVVTLSEAGPPGFRFDFPIWYGTWVSSKTPAHNVRVLAEASPGRLRIPSSRSGSSNTMETP
jgi:Tripartite tricarboxylate transporter family receptor/Major Facilitator Superfamily